MGTTLGLIGYVEVGGIFGRGLKGVASAIKEAAATVQEADFDPLMTAAIAAKQDGVAQQARDGVFDGLDGNSPWQDYADRLIGSLKP